MAFLESNRGMARTYLSGLNEAGLSGSQALRELRDLGLGYREQDFYRDWRETTGFAGKSDTFKYIRKDYKPTAGTIQITDENLSRNYSYFYKVTGTDKETGASITKDWRFSTDELVTREQAESAIEDNQGYVEQELDLEDITIMSVGIKQRLYL